MADRKVLVIGSNIIVITRVDGLVIRQSFSFEEALIFYRAFGDALTIARLASGLPAPFRLASED